MTQTLTERALAYARAMWPEAQIVATLVGFHSPSGEPGWIFSTEDDQDFAEVWTVGPQDYGYVSTSLDPVSDELRSTGIGLQRFYGES